MNVATNPDWEARAAGVDLSLSNFIDGNWRAGAGAPIDKLAPRDGALLYSFAGSISADVDAAVAAARRAFEDGRWSKLSVDQRRAVLERFAQLIEEHQEEMALLETLDVGKPISSALAVDAPMAAEIVRHAVASAINMPARVYGADRGSLSYELRRPIGVVGAIIGWNFPLMLAVGKIAPALVTGNSLVLKPSEFTGLSAHRLSHFAMEAGIPDGVLNIVYGAAPAGAAIARHSDVDLLTFTGSTATGKLLLVGAGESNLKRLVLECGGKAANIVFEDCADVDAVADAVVARAFWNQGQVCTASSRLLLHASIYDKFVEILARKVAAIKGGDPLQPETTFGTLASREHQTKVKNYITEGLAGGATVLSASRQAAPFENGFYQWPVLFGDVSADMKIAQEEIFGPVLAVMRFSTEAEAVRIANSTLYGLSAVVWTSDLGRAHRVSQEIQAGWIVVNGSSSPQGGPGAGALTVGGHKQSGFGVEGGLDGLASYTSTTAVQLFA